MERVPISTVVLRSQRVPLGDESLTAGRYDCQVTVLDATAQKVAFWRAPIVVVP